VAEVDGADQGFDGVGQDRVLLPPAGGPLPAAEQDVVAEPELPGDRRERLLGDGRGPHARKVALGDVRVGAVEVLGDDDAEHRVPEELQALVGG
jgi:hypothetical protein